MGTAIKGEHLSKLYHIGKKSSGSLREALTERAKKIFSKQAGDPTEFWALRNASFEVEDGEVLGIIGKNGAGKSTLLKILSRITEPTEGRAIIHGRVSSLLEVGTGFHPELTGRENIFMNGSILGMKRIEIKKKFDEIVSFSGISQFIDTPVKRYSSGMYVRLAFAVAAHLEPEILIIDEVLAVGDAEFQKKCLGKMKDVSEQEGRTVLFVSHNMSAVSRLCTQVMVLNKGEISFNGNTEEGINNYFAVSTPASDRKVLNRESSRGSNEYKFSEFTLLNSKKEPSTFFRTGDDILFKIIIEPNAGAPEKNVFITVGIKDRTGSRLLSLASGLYDKKVLLKGKTEVTWELKHNPLAAAVYSCDLIMFEFTGGTNLIDMVEDAFVIEITEGDYFGSGRIQTRGADKFYHPFNITVTHQ